MNELRLEHPPVDRSDEALQRDVKLLGNLLGKVLIEQEGEAFLELEEKIRLLCKEIRQKKSTERHAELIQLIDDIGFDDADNLVRAFGTYFHLVNVAEQFHQIRITRATEVSQGALENSLAQTIQTLAESVFSAKAVQDLLNTLSIEPTLTAHPTEALRHTILRKRRQIALFLERLENPAHSIQEREAIIEQLVALITSLWQTDEVRSSKLTIQDEVVGHLYYFERVFFDVLLVFGGGGGPDEVQLPPGQGGLDHVGHIYGPLGRPGPHDGMQLVHEEDESIPVGGHLIEHLLDAFLEFPPVLGPGHEGVHVEFDQPLSP